MRHDPQGFPPFGDDEDANAAVRSFAGVAGLLAQESQKLANMKTSNLNLRSAQEERVASLRAEITSRASAVHVDPDEFLAACLNHIGKRQGRKVEVAPVAAARREVDEEEAQLQDRVYAAEIAEERAERINLDAQARARGTQQRFDAAKRTADRARTALASHRSNRRAAA